MRPHKPTVRKPSTADHRVRRLLQEGLGWLRGFPIDRVDDGCVRWVTVPELGSRADPNCMVVDRPRLRRTVLVRNKLVRQFPRALPRVVGDRDAWTAAIDRRIEHLKATVHHGRPLPDLAELLGRHSQTRAVLARAERSDAAAELFTALAWLSDDAMRRNLKAAIDHNAHTIRERIEGRGPLLAVHVVELLREHGSAAAFLVERLAGRATVPMHGPTTDTCSNAVHEAIESNQRPSFPSQPAPASARPLADWLTNSLVKFDASGRRSLLPLLSLLLPHELERQWASWWRRVLRVCGEATKAGQPSPRHRIAPRTRELRRLHGKLLQLEEQQPPIWHADTIFERLDGWLLVLDGRRCRASWIAQALRSLPEVQTRRLVRVGFFAYWYELYRDGENQPRIRDLTRATAAYWSETAGCRGRFTPWRSIIRPSGNGFRHTRSGPEYFCPAIPIRMLFALLTRAALRGRLGSWEVQCGLLEVCQDLDSTAALFAAVEHAGVIKKLAALRPHLRRAAVRLSDGDPEAFAALVPRLVAVAWSEDSDAQLAALADRSELRPNLLSALMDQALSPLVAKILEQTAMLGTRGSVAKGSRAVGRLPAFVRRYPPALRGHLKQLLRFAPDAERIAHEVLGRTFPDVKQLNRERAALAARIESAPEPRRVGMQRRLRALDERIGKPVEVSQRRMTNLENKLVRRTTRAQLELLLANGRRALRPVVGKYLRVDPPDSWLEDQYKLRVLRGVLQLDPTFRKLAFRLLRRRLDPPPWDLREVDANARFLRRMRRRGLDMRPWVDAIHTEQHENPHLGRVDLAFAEDPWDILQMGAHFQTCLSPDDFNFFSAVANAADVNKRVLYAKNVAGEVLGRCLFALTKNGEVLTFHAYAHQRCLEFGKLVGSFCESLVAAMGTTTTTIGDVENLVATRWYDDGPVDQTGRLAFLWDATGLDFSNVADDALRSELERRLGARRLDLAVLHAVLWHDAVETRPALVTSLLPILGQSDSTPAELLLRAIQLGRRAGALAATGRLVEDLWRRRHRLPAWRQETLAKELLEHGRPADALRILRESRATGVRSWDSKDEDVDRIELAARAHDALHRPAVARRLYEVLLDRASDYAKAEYRAHVARLNAILG